ncbi:TenA family protein [Turicimonas muris]|uniref:TenA family protein n=1 Tax=Turicimonas muris TaxID=1796652 RepID=UPI002494A2EE|nr:TenA family protein [Turicimonas muris]
MIDRRAFVFALGTCVAYPSVFASYPKEWTNEAESALKDYVHGLVSQPYLKELFNGTLSKASFNYYLEQNVFYLKVYARSLSLLASKFSTEEEIRFFSHHSSVTIDLISYSRETYQRINQKEMSVLAKPEKTVLDYVNFEAAHCAFSDLSVAASAMYPCFWVYWQIGMEYRKMKRATENNPYSDWLAGYSDTAYDEQVKKFGRILNRLAANSSPATRKEMLAAFVSGCGYEKSFFETCYKVR